MTEAAKPTCFIAMPISMSVEAAADYREDREHWRHVLESLLVPAVNEAGYEPIRPTAKGSSLIQAEIVRHLESADMVLVDLSRHNPNVFFEMGIRTALNRPVALVCDDSPDLDLPFDTSMINTHFYSAQLRYWAMNAEIAGVADHIKNSSSVEGNPIWKYFGLKKSAESTSASEGTAEARLELLLREVTQMRADLEQGQYRSVQAATRGALSTPALNHQFQQDLVAIAVQRMMEVGALSGHDFTTEGITNNYVNLLTQEPLSDSTWLDLTKLAARAGVTLTVATPSGARSFDPDQQQR